LYHDKRVRVNRNITAPQVRLITNDGTMVGIKPIYEAGAMARAAGLDLVEISPSANPPVCKIMDFSKYLYEKDKQERENRKKQKAGVLKEIRLNPRIALNDLNTKVKHAEVFLKEQNKVRITVVFRGRENQHRDLGEQILTSVKEMLSQVGMAEGRPQLMGNRMSIMLSPAAKPGSRAQGAVPKASVADSARGRGNHGVVNPFPTAEGTPRAVSPPVANPREGVPPRQASVSKPAVPPPVGGVKPAQSAVQPAAKSDPVQPPQPPPSPPISKAER